MKNYIKAEGGQVGFGESKESAEEDLFINKCRQDILNDTVGKFLKRREELYPWQPSDNMLHLNNLGCLVYKDNKILNTKNGKTIDVINKGHSIYYYVATLFGSELTYTDITVSIRPELDSFFTSISKDFIPIKDMPTIQLLSIGNGFNPYVIYSTDNGILIAMSDVAVGMKFIGEEFYNVVELEDTHMSVPLFSYIGYKIGCIFKEGGIEVIGKED